MPHVVVKLIAGRPESLKRRLAEQIVRDVSSILEVDADSVSVALEDVRVGEWMSAVYEPEIAPALDTLYKQPGYGPRG